MIPSRKHRRTLSSQRWLSRQHTDPYVQKARRYGYRSRSAFKLLEMDAKYKFLKPGLCVLDLGCAPGGWSQVVVRRTGHVVGVDRVPLKPINRVFFVQGDVTEEVTKKTLFEALSGRADVVLSDMAPSATGHKATDRNRGEALGFLALKFALRLRAKVFLVKSWQGSELYTQLQEHFGSVLRLKPPACRPESSELYLLARR